MDVPRLSTLQALLIILKAREQAPKRGYYYRSWMSIVQCVQMGKDLGLDDQYLEHQAGKQCVASQSKCLLKNRIWQTIFVCEVMIGSPQGKPQAKKMPYPFLLLTREQAERTYRSKKKRSILASRGRYQTATSPNTTYHGTSLTSPEWSATSVEWGGPTGDSRRARIRTGASIPTFYRSVPI